MTAPGGQASIVALLPPRAALGPFDPRGCAARVLARADRFARPPGWRAQLVRRFDVLPRGLPVAALTRQADAGDAAGATWVRADPAWLQPDMASVRLMGWSEFGLSKDEAEALLQPLRPVFGDAGFPISAPVPSRWYLMAPADARLPGFSDPHEAMGDDLAAHLPDRREDPRWHRLAGEAQVLLHNHPINAARRARGLPPVNALWFWGAGRLPDSVSSRSRRLVGGDDVLLRSLATRAGLPVAAGDEAPRIGDLLDLRGLRDAAALDRVVGAALEALGRDPAATLELDFGDGDCFAWRRGHRWRFWRRPPAGQGT